MHTRGQGTQREEAKRRCYLLERRRGRRAATARCAAPQPMPIPWEGRSEGEAEARARVTAQRKLRVGTRAWNLSVFRGAVG